jgi:hypothetical protein
MILCLSIPPTIRVSHYLSSRQATHGRLIYSQFTRYLNRCHAKFAMRPKNKAMLLLYIIPARPHNPVLIIIVSHHCCIIYEHNPSTFLIFYVCCITSPWHGCIVRSPTSHCQIPASLGKSFCDCRTYPNRSANTSNKCNRTIRHHFSLIGQPLNCAARGNHLRPTVASAISWALSRPPPVKGYVLFLTFREILKKYRLIQFLGL